MLRLAFEQSASPCVKNVDCTVVTTFMNHSVWEDLLLVLHLTFSLNLFCLARNATR